MGQNQEQYLNEFCIQWLRLAKTIDYFTNFYFPFVRAKTRMQSINFRESWFFASMLVALIFLHSSERTEARKNVTPYLSNTSEEFFFENACSEIFLCKPAFGIPF